MPTFEIRYGGFRRDASLRAGFHYFDVGCPGTEARFAVQFPDSLGRQWGLEGRANADEIQRRAVLGYLKEHLAAIDALTRDSARFVLLTAGEPPKFSDEWAVCQVPEQCPYERKECRFRRRLEAGVTCGVAHSRDPVGGATTTAICERCGLPSTDLLCDNLVYPETVGAGTDAAHVVKRTLSRAACDVASDHFSEAAQCIPGGANCWVQTYEPEEAQIGVAAQAAQFSVAEAIDQVNAAFRSRYGQKLIVIEEARSIADLAGDCDTDDSLQHKLQVLAGLLEGMQLSGLLTEDEAEGNQGTIDLLERLMARDFATLPQQYVRNLRNVNKLAAGYPRHAKVKNIERAHAELGLPYPVTDYAKAWAIVSETFIQTLRQLALQVG